MNVELNVDWLKRPEITFPWGEIAGAVRLRLGKTLGAEPDQCTFTPEASEAGKIRCFYQKGLGTLDVPFYVEIDLGLLAESFAGALLEQPAFAGHRLIGGSISTNEHGDVTVVPEPPTMVPTLAEPTLDYQWSKARSNVRKAAGTYAVVTHADY